MIKRVIVTPYQEPSDDIDGNKNVQKLEVIINENPKIGYHLEKPTLIQSGDDQYDNENFLYERQKANDGNVQCTYMQ